MIPFPETALPLHLKETLLFDLPRRIEELGAMRFARGRLRASQVRRSFPHRILWRKAKSEKCPIPPWCMLRLICIINRPLKISMPTEYRSNRDNNRSNKRKYPSERAKNHADNKATAKRRKSGERAAKPRMLSRSRQQSRSREIRQRAQRNGRSHRESG